MKSRLVLSVIGVFCAAALFAQGGGTQFGLSAENPGISVVGDFIGHYNITEDKGFLGIGEVELGFQAYVDPFARVDVFIGYHGIELAHHNHDDDDDDHEHGLEVEEAVLTLTSLPFGFQFSIGRMRSKIGFVNVLHLHDFHFAQYPMLIQEYWDHEGLITDGARLSWLAPLPIWVEFVVEGQSLLNQDAIDFVAPGMNIFIPIGDEMGISLSGFGYFDSGLEKGNELVNHLRGHVDDDEKADLENELAEIFENPAFGFGGWGAGLRYKWAPLSVGFMNHFVIQGEVMSRALGPDFYTGFYALAQLKFLRRWTLGVMYNMWEVPHFHAHDDDDHHHHGDGAFEKEIESVFSAALSFYASEFQRIRLQYDMAMEHDETDHSLTLQWTFVLGPHAPHAY